MPGRWNASGMAPTFEGVREHVKGGILLRDALIAERRHQQCTLGPERLQKPADHGLCTSGDASHGAERAVDQQHAARDHAGVAGVTGNAVRRGLRFWVRGRSGRDIDVRIGIGVSLAWLNRSSFRNRSAKIGSRLTLGAPHGVAPVVKAPRALLGDDGAVDQVCRRPRLIEQVGDRRDIPDDLGPSGRNREVVAVIAAHGLDEVVADGPRPAT